MKFYSYINEDIGFDNRDKKIIEYMEKCKPFLKDWKKCNTDLLLMSGRKKLENYFIGTVRKNRRPMNTKKETHDTLNKLFKEKFGVEARGNSLFCTSLYSDAGSYGDAYVIFPIGKYKIIWSWDVGDLYIHLSYSGKNFKRKDLEDVEDLKTVVETYEMGNLCGALNSGNEVMLMCDQYLALHTIAFKYPYQKNKIISMIDQVI